MILGMPLSTFTPIHVLISLVGMVTGFVAVFGMRANHRFPGWTAIFLITILLTSISRQLALVFFAVLAIAGVRKFRPRPILAFWIPAGVNCPQALTIGDLYE
jgi:purine-cytosine permease-like protein